MAIVGLLVGPVLGFANPKEAMGADVFSPIVSLAVAIILFTSDTDNGKSKM
jgi:NhaP-type Na+/H+ or K+/H+ antiporter